MVIGVPVPAHRAAQSAPIEAATQQALKEAKSVPPPSPAPTSYYCRPNNCSLFYGCNLTQREEGVGS
jgi:hypothetical protein